MWLLLSPHSPIPMYINLFSILYVSPSQTLPTAVAIGHILPVDACITPWTNIERILVPEYSALCDLHRDTVTSWINHLLSPCSWLILDSFHCLCHFPYPFYCTKQFVKKGCGFRTYVDQIQNKCHGTATGIAMLQVDIGTSCH